MGYIGAWIPEEYGGMGYDFTTYCVIFEELVTNQFPICGAMSGHNFPLFALNFWGTEEQKQKYLIPLAKGEKIGCGAITDPAGLGNHPEWGFSATETADGYMLNGTKVFITNSEVADIKCIFGRPAPGNDGKLDHMYIIEKGTPGCEDSGHEVKVLPDTKSDWGTISMKDVVIPKMNKVVDNGFGAPFMGPSYLLLCIQSMVLAELGFLKTLRFAKERRRFGRPLTDLQSVSHKLADAAINNEASRALIYTAAGLWDKGDLDQALRIASMAKAFVCEQCTKSLHELALIHGGIAWTQPGLIGIMWAASMQLEIAEMPPAVHRDLIMESYGIEAGWKQGQD
jgi:alkylation response protein AidB-like acyl-CoA dehydrogenase